MTDMRAKMKADAKRAKLVAKETIAILKDYSKMAWKALKNPLMSLGAAAILSSCGIVRNRVSNADVELNKDNSEQVIKTQLHLTLEHKLNLYANGLGNLYLFNQ